MNTFLVIVAILATIIALVSAITSAKALQALKACKAVAEAPKEPEVKHRKAQTVKSEKKDVAIAPTKAPAKKVVAKKATTVVAKATKPVVAKKATTTFDRALYEATAKELGLWNEAKHKVNKVNRSAVYEAMAKKAVAKAPTKKSVSASFDRELWLKAAELSGCEVINNKTHRADRELIAPLYEALYLSK